MGQSVMKTESDDLAIDDLFKSSYTVPDFQREYVWKRDQVEVVVEQKLFEMQEDIKRLYDLDSIDYGYYGDYDHFVEWLEKDTPKRQVQYVEDTVRELKGWACFEPKPGSSRSKQGGQKKIGRNHPRPCGSGKKYKKCCGK